MSQPAASLATDTAQAWRSPLLGERRAIDLPQGTIEYFERGRGPTLVLVHGWLVNANLWRKVVDALQKIFGGWRPNLPWAPHGSRRLPPPTLGPAGSPAAFAPVLSRPGLTALTL